MDDTKPTKLIINIKEGIIQAEGDESFVRDVYNDFKEVVSQRVITSNELLPAPPALEQATSVQETGGAAKLAAAQPKAKAKRQSATADSAFKPKFDNELDTTGIDDYLARHLPKNNNEKILVFAAFLRDKLGKATCTAHEIYTCFFVTKQKIPAAFVQAFITCQGRTHFIKYTTMMDIEIAIPGQNWLNGQGKKQAAAI